ncbi:MAG: type II toxin-antitoxin system HicA family toxin [Spirochaetaceae bacterium]|nr:type II toxin-antitoxin system HicA family toxin [Spirochaetaceae bacterium]
MTGRDLLKLLMENGWELDRVRGSHHILVKE